MFWLGVVLLLSVSVYFFRQGIMDAMDVVLMHREAREYYRWGYALAWLVASLPLLAGGACVAAAVWTIVNR